MPDTHLPRDHRHVMLDRQTKSDDPDFFPTPPKAVRALLAGLQERTDWQPHGTCWEPAAGQGHMVLALREAFSAVHASDIEHYAPIRPDMEIKQGDFLAAETPPAGMTAIITNPPYGKLPERFLRHALGFEPELLAFLLTATKASTGWMQDVNTLAREAGYTPIRFETGGHRISIHKGTCRKDAKTATIYSWFCFLRVPYQLRATPDWRSFYIDVGAPEFEDVDDYGMPPLLQEMIA